MIKRFVDHAMDLRSQAKWIWSPGFNDADEELPGKFVLFRRTFELDQVPTTACEVNMSADTRYRLYINGNSVAFGPCKSYPARWYYETVNITPFLRRGTNVIAAKVLRFFPSQIGSSSMAIANVPGLIVWGEVGGESIVTDESWSCREDDSIRLQPRSQWNYILGPPFLSLDERVDLSKSIPYWQAENATPSEWSNAVPAVTPVKMMPAMEPWKLFPRPIPALPEVPRMFDGAVKCSGGTSLESWNDLLVKQLSVSIQAHETATVEFESSVLTTAFLEFDFVGGRDTEVSILYSECYEKDLGVDKSPFPLPRSKADRRDWKNGRLYGNEDHVALAAAEGDKTHYEPFWFRTFRYIRLQITTHDTPLTITRIAHRETHYPLEITTQITLPPILSSIWDISLNTLRNCMHETYEDCPFYEQNQFAMDARLQMLCTYQISRDDRLARKTIHEFFASRRDDGLLETNAPVSFRAVNIPQFSLFWILMLHDHMRYFDDRILLRRYIGCVDGILEHFQSLVNIEGLVGAFDSEAWAFVDWVSEWNGSPMDKGGIRNMAVPPVYKQTGVAAYNSLLYSWILQHAADVCTSLNRNDTASEYRARSQALNNAVQTHCWNGTFFTDGPGTQALCQHTQIFAILSQTITGPDATSLLQRTLTHSTMPKCSSAFQHYIFRAMSLTGLYEFHFAQMTQGWKAMLDNGLTTCTEGDVQGSRSDCHAWSAGFVFEAVSEIYGIGPSGTGEVSENGWVGQPRRRLLKEGKGTFVVGGGEQVLVGWEGEDGEVVVETETL